MLPWDGSSGLLLSGNSFLDAELTAVLLDGSSAVLRDNTWANPGTDVVQQRCEGVPLLTSEDLAGVSTWELCPDALYLIDAAFTFESF